LIAEAGILQENQLSPSGSFSEHGFGIPANRPKLNNIFGTGEREVVFFFNTYEISAGAMGPTELAIPWGLYATLSDPACICGEQTETLPVICRVIHYPAKPDLRGPLYGNPVFCPQPCGIAGWQELVGSA
jgi:hypothetical protein